MPHHPVVSVAPVALFDLVESIDLMVPVDLVDLVAPFDPVVLVAPFFPSSVSTRNKKPRLISESGLG